MNSHQNCSQLRNSCLTSTSSDCSHSPSGWICLRSGSDAASTSVPVASPATRGWWCEATEATLNNIIQPQMYFACNKQLLRHTFTLCTRICQTAARWNCGNNSAFATQHWKVDNTHDIEMSGILINGFIFLLQIHQFYKGYVCPSQILNMPLYTEHLSITFMQDFVEFIFNCL